MGLFGNARPGKSDPGTAKAGEPPDGPPTVAPLPPAADRFRREDDLLQRRTVICTAEQLAPLLDQAGELLTRPRGAFHQPDAAHLLAYFENGLLLIAETARQERSVRNFLDLLDHRRRPCDIHLIKDALLPQATAKPGGEQPPPRILVRATEQENRILRWIHQAAQEGITDIHASTEDDHAKIEMRVDSVLYETEKLQLEVAKALMSTAYGMCEHKSDPVYSPFGRHHGIITPHSANLPGTIIGIRMQWSPLGDSGRYMAMRNLYRTSFERQTLAGLGFMPRQAAALEQIRRTPYGMIIFSGPVGSGKTTTTALMLVNSYEEADRGINVVTFEDPIEYRIPGIKQTTINNLSEGNDREKQTHEAIRTLLRQDANVALIGETRDVDTATLALNAARSGMQVWTTVHSNLADKVPARLRNIGLSVEDIYDETAYIGYVCQRLVRRLCSHCRLPLRDSIARSLLRPDLLGRLSRSLPLRYLPNVFVERRGGCGQCKGRGFAGRTVVAEIIRTNAGFMDCLVQAPMSNRARQHWIAEMGGVTLMAHGLVKIATGQSSPSEIERVMGDLSLDIPKDRLVGLIEETLAADAAPAGR